jgi:peptidyl-prolyl cis-trans isomerase D
MLQLLRERAQGFLAWVVVLCIAVTFIFFGLGDYFSTSGSSQIAAKVDGEKILWQTVDVLSERLARQYEGRVDEKTLQQQILNTLVQRTALLLAAKKQGFRVGDTQIADLLIQIPAFQENGQFSKEKYLTTLAQASYTDNGFRHELAQDVLMGQWEQGVMQTSFATKAELNSMLALLDQKRNFGYLVIPANYYQKEISVSPDEISAYYEKNRSLFVAPETVALEYVTLSLKALAQTIKPTSDEIAAYYQEHQTAYTLPERVHARHILILAAENDPAADLAAKKKIDAILKTLKQGGDFAAIAKVSSEDPGSAAQGGDLGWFVRGQMVPEFENAAFAMHKPNSISEPIRTSFGYHLIQVVEHKDSAVRPLADVKSLVAGQIQNEKAELLFAEQSEKMATLALQEKNSLGPLVAALGVKLEETKAFGRPGGEGIASNAAVIQAAFSGAVLIGENSSLIPLSEGEVVVVRVKKHQPAKQESLEEAKDNIRQLLVAEGSSTKAKAVGQKIVQAIRDGGKSADLAKQNTLVWTSKTNVGRSTQDIDRQVLLMAFSLGPVEKTATAASTKGFSLQNGDYVVIALNKIILGEWSTLEPDVQKTYQQGLQGAGGQWEYGLYVNQVLRDSNVKIMKHE